MKIELAQMITLTSYGNAYLNNKPISLDLDHSTTNSCEKINFIELISNGEISKEMQQVHLFKEKKTNFLN